MKQLFKRLGCASILLAGGVAASLSHAQMNSPALRVLAASGNDLQRSVGFFIADSCDQLGAMPSLDAFQQQLFSACSFAGNEAAAILSSSASTLNYDGLLTALNYIAPEEAVAIGSAFTDNAQSQLANVAGRLAFLRTGVATGLAQNQWGSGVSGGAAGTDFSKFSYYINSNSGFGDRDQTERENGFDYDSFNVTFGADYRLSDQLVGGAALSLSESEMDFDDNSGKTESDGFDLTVYGSYYMGDIYFDAVFGLGQYDYDSTRGFVISGLGGLLTSSSTSADSMHFSVGAGYNFAIREYSNDAFVRLDRVSVDVDGYRESGAFLAMEVGDQKIDSTQIVLGDQISTTKSLKWGVWAPYAGVEWRFELEDDTRVVTAGYVLDRLGSSFTFESDEADSSYGLISVGSNFVLAQGMQLFVNYDFVVGLEDVNANTLSAGVRFEL